jgi:hypothetical protein
LTPGEAGPTISLLPEGREETILLAPARQAGATRRTEMTVDRNMAKGNDDKEKQR